MSKSKKLFICQSMKPICDYLNFAHTLPEHDQMEKTAEYQRVIRIGKDLNKASNEYRSPCFCADYYKKANAKKHSGHRFVRVKR